MCRLLDRPRLLLIMALLLLAAVLGGLFLNLRRPATDLQVSAIQRLPAYSLIYPGAEQLAYVEATSTIPHGGTRGALAVQVFGVPVAGSVDVNQVFNWYAQQLRDSGWQLDTDGSGDWTSTCYRLTTDPFLTEYHRQTHAAATPSAWSSRYTPLFEVVIERICVP